MLAILQNFVSDTQTYGREIKRALLLFDAIIVPNLRETEQRIGRADDEGLQVDLDFLAKHGLVRTADPHNYRAARMNPDVRSEEKKIKKLSIFPAPHTMMKWNRKHLGRATAQVFRFEPRDGVSFPPSELQTRGPLHRLNAEHYVARSLASRLRDQGHPALSVFDSIGVLPTAPDVRKELIIKVVIENLEFPDSDTALTDIVAFRDDVGNRQRLFGLRQWVRGLAEHNITEAEIREEMRYLTEEHHRSLKRHRLKGQATAFEAFIVVGAEILESFVKLRLAKLAELGVHMFKAADDVLSSEASIKGQEMSYLFRVRKQLKKT